MIPYGKQNITNEDIDAVIEVLKSEFLTQGPKIKEFEEEFAKYIGSKYAVAVSSATAGLHMVNNLFKNKNAPAKMETGPASSGAIES